MDQSRYDVAVHLEAALAEWTAQILQAHLALAGQISHAQERFAPELAGDAAGKSGSDALAEVRADLDVLGKTLADADRQPGAVSGCVDRLRDAISNLYAELRKFRSQAAAPAAKGRNQEQNAQRLAQALRERDAAREELAALRAEIESLRGVHEKMVQSEKEAQSAIASKAFNADGHKRRMGEILVDAGVITREQLESALREQRENPQRPLGSIFVDNGYTSEDVVAQVLASQLRLRFVRLKREPIDINAVHLVSQQIATRHMAVALRATPIQITVAMTNPLDLVALDDLERATGRRVEPLVATASDVSETIARYYSAK